MHRDTGPLFGVTAVIRLGVLLPGGSDVITPIGFGAGLDMRVHAARRFGPLRLGGGVHLGHTRFLSRRELDGELDGELQSVIRWASLGHSDFTAGPSLQIVMGPVFAELDAGVGVAVLVLRRPTGVEAGAEEQIDDVSLMIRPQVRVVVPIRQNQGIAIGVAYHKYVSGTQVPTDALDRDSEPTNPFDALVEIGVGYHFMF